MALVKRGKYFHYRFMIDTVLYRGSTKQATLGKARQFEAVKMAQAREGNLTPHSRRAPILAEFAKRFLSHVDALTAANQLDTSTRATYHNGWRLLAKTPIAGARIDKIGTAEAATLQFPGSPSNANQALRTLRRMLSIACEFGILRAAPRINLQEEHGREAIIEPWVEDLLLEFAPDDLADMIAIMLDCGMRPEEVCRMQWEHIRWTENAILVPHGKSLRSRRFVGMTERMCGRLTEARERNKALAARNKREESPWVFPSPRAAAGHTVNLNKAWTGMILEVREAIAKRRLSNLPDGLVLYSARHTFATQFLANGGDLAKLKVLLGHASIITTEKYLHPSTGDAAEVMNRHNRRKAGLHIVKSA